MRQPLILVALLCSVALACSPLAPLTRSAAGERGSDEWWDFVVEVGPHARVLAVTARFETGASGVLETDPGSALAIRNPRLDSGEPLDVVDGGWRLPAGLERDAASVRVLWEADLDQLERTRSFQRVESGDATAYVTPAGAFLLRPRDEWRGVRARLRFELAPGVELASGMMRGLEPHTFVLPASRLDHLPATVLGDFRRTELAVSGSSVEVAILPGERAVSDEEVERFVAAHTGAVADFYGRFPVAHSLVVVLPSRRGGYGRANGSGGASVLYLLDRRADFDELMDDWVLVHELLHFACPLLARDHHWFEEGLSTYLEPLVRHREGWESGAGVWAEFVSKLHNGLPQAGDRGLDRTPTWGRTYWGGALFCLLADVEIRRLSANRLGLRDAMRAVVESGGSILRPAGMRETLETADEALGLAVLVPLWEAMRHDPYPVDLDRLWAELGIVRFDGRISFDDSAPLAAVREAIAATRESTESSTN